MRIVFVINSLIYGGAETQVILLSRALAARGHGVTIYTLNDENPRIHELDGTGVTVVVDRKRAKLDPGLIRRLRKCIDRVEADIVHGFLLDGNLHARLAVAGTGVPALNSERSDNYRLPLQHRLGLFLTRWLTAGLVANSHSGARFAQKLYRLPDARVHVVWNGFDLAGIDARRSTSAIEPKKEFFASPDVKIACLVGMIRPEKDYLLALRVAAALTREDSAWRVLFVGDCLPQTSNYKEAVLRAHRKLGLEGRAIFAGLRSDVIEIVSRCDAVFSTSIHEGFPNVVLEAMAAGTPVVSTAYSDVRLILPEAWQVVEHREPDHLVEAILQADRERDMLVQKQRTWVEANATIAKAVDRLEEIYRRYLRTMAAT